MNFLKRIWNFIVVGFLAAILAFKSTIDEIDALAEEKEFRKTHQK